MQVLRRIKSNYYLMRLNITFTNEVQIHLSDALNILVLQLISKA